MRPKASTLLISAITVLLEAACLQGIQGGSKVSSAVNTNC